LPEGHRPKDVLRWLLLHLPPLKLEAVTGHG